MLKTFKILHRTNLSLKVLIGTLYVKYNVLTLEKTKLSSLRRQEICVTSLHLHTEQEGGDLGLKKKRSQFFSCVVTVALSLLFALAP